MVKHLKRLTVDVGAALAQLRIRRVALAGVLAVAAMAVAMPMGQAQSNAAQAQLNADHQVLGPDASTQAAYSLLLGQHPEALAGGDAAQVRPSITLAGDGTFATSSPLFAKRVSTINAAIRDYRSQPLQSTPWLGTIEAQARWWCGYLPNWLLDAFAWEVIIVGGVVGIVGAFIDVTIVGVPLGAVLNALGIAYSVTGGFLLWYFDKYYPNGVWRCLWI
jgi:hypothetical protein